MGAGFLMVIVELSSSLERRALPIEKSIRMNVEMPRMCELEDERKKRRKDLQPEAPAHNRLERALAGSAGFMHDDVASAISSD